MSVVAVDVEYDDALIARAAEGDQEAFGDLYMRYSQGIYDFAARTIRDRDLAGDVVQTTFTRAWEAVQKGTRPQNVRAWLYTIARNDAIDQLRRAQRIVSDPYVDSADDERTSFIDTRPDPSRGPEEQVYDQELASLVWKAASGLNPRQYSLLDLHLRQNLSPDELANSLGLRRDNVYMMLSRLRDSLEESVTLLLLVQRGRRECTELDALLAERSTLEMTRDMRRLVGKHLETCPRCQELTRRYISPAEIFAGLAAMRIPVELHNSVWQRIVPQLDPGPIVGGPPTPPVGVPTPPPVAPLPPPVMGPPPPLTPPLMPTGLESSLWLAQPAILAKIGLIATSTVASIALVATVVLQPIQGEQSAALHDPDDVRSVSHVVGEPSLLNVVRILWTPVADATGYAIRWGDSPRDLPDAVIDLSGTADGVTSAPLAPGSWYFHLRTRGQGGDWTSTVHLGPFIILPPPQSAGPPPAIEASTALTETDVSEQPQLDGDPDPVSAAEEEDEMVVAADVSPDPIDILPTMAPTSTATRSPAGTNVPSAGASLQIAQPTPTPMFTLSPRPSPSPRSPTLGVTRTPLPISTPVPSAAPLLTTEPTVAAVPSPIVVTELPTPQAVAAPTEGPLDIGPLTLAGTPVVANATAVPIDHSSSASNPSSTPTSTALAGALLAPSPGETAQPTATATVLRPPTRTSTVASSPTQTVVASAPPTRTLTPGSSCSPMTLTSLVPTVQAERVVVNWTVTGGCAPYSGSITASGGSSFQAPIATLTGSVIDNPPHCAGLVTYRLTLRDASGATVGGSASVLIDRDCS